MKTLLTLLFPLVALAGQGHFQPKVDWYQALCLAKMVYGEAASESYVAKVAVASVAVNRSHDPRFARETLCATVRAPHQFKGYRDSIILRNVIDRRAWHDSVRAARQAMLNPSTEAVMFRSGYAPAEWYGFEFAATLDSMHFYEG